VGRWGFRKTFSLGRGARISLGKKSVGFSIGSGPFRWGVNSRTGTRTRLTIPGTGLYWEDRKGWTRRSKQHAPSQLAAPHAAVARPPTSAGPVPQSVFFAAPTAAAPQTAPTLPAPRLRANPTLAAAAVTAAAGGALFIVLKLLGH
jgi:hypothetical protein